MNNKRERVLRGANGALNGIIWVISAVALFFGLYVLLDEYTLYRNADDPSLLTYKPALEAARDVPQLSLPGQAAWLHIENSYIDFPVMQGEDNFEYLYKDPYGEYKLSGSIFLDSRNDGALRDEYSMVYGHHMDHYAMFGSLDLFAAEAYFDLHRTGWVAVEGAVYDLDLFAVVWGDAKDYIVFEPQGKTAAAVTPYIRENASILREYDENARILALSTCAGRTESSRLIVFGTLKERQQ